MMNVSRRTAAVVANVQSATSRRDREPTPRPRAIGASQRPNVAWCPSGPNRVTAPSRRSVAASTMANAAPVPSRPDREGVLDESVGVSGQEWLRDRHPASDLRVLADGEHLGCIREAPRSQDEVVDGQDRSRFAIHRTALYWRIPTHLCSSRSRGRLRAVMLIGPSSPTTLTTRMSACSKSMVMFEDGTI